MSIMNTGCSDSDTSDEDYIPTNEKQELLSEEESGEDSDKLVEEDNSTDKKRKKRCTKKTRKKVRKQEEESGEQENAVEKESCQPEDDKKRVDALWADFMKDTGFKSRAELEKEAKKTTEQPKQDNCGENKPLSEVKHEKEIKEKSEKIKVTQVFDFAGEEIKVEKEIPVESVKLNKTVNSSSATDSSKKAARSGLSSVLSQIGKKQKITTLEKSKLDWEKFKKDEKIEDELKAYSKSKDGYLDKQDFLQRADLRQFELEKDIRNTLRTNRINNSSI